MSTTISPPSVLADRLAENWSLADLREHLGGIPIERIRGNPPPGQATVEDLIRNNDQKNGICELIDGVLVEKPLGQYESRLAHLIGYFLENFLEDNDLGICLGADGPLELSSDQVRVPDLTFVSWDQFPDGVPRDESVLRRSPDLAIEVLSKSNTKAEMNRKLDDYFESGTKLAWYIDPVTETAKAYSSPDDFQVIEPGGILDGGDLLPGFKLSLAELFQRANRTKPAPNE